MAKRKRKASFSAEKKKDYMVGFLVIRERGGLTARLVSLVVVSPLKAAASDPIRHAVLPKLCALQQLSVKKGPKTISWSKKGKKK